MVHSDDTCWVSFSITSKRWEFRWVSPQSEGKWGEGLEPCIPWGRTNIQGREGGLVVKGDWYPSALCVWNSQNLKISFWGLKYVLRFGLFNIILNNYVSAWKFYPLSSEPLILFHWTDFDLKHIWFLVPLKSVHL